MKKLFDYLKLIIKRIYTTVFTRKVTVYTPEEISTLIKEFVEPRKAKDSYPYYFDDFLNFRLDLYGEFIQELIYCIECKFPARHENEWCNNRGKNALLILAGAIDSNIIPLVPEEEDLLALKNRIIPNKYLFIFQS